MGVFLNGPYHAAGFDLGRAGIAGLRDERVTVCKFYRPVGGGEDVRVKGGLQPKVMGNEAVYEYDAEMTMRHGWLINRNGIPVRAVLFTFNRELTRDLPRG
jgi:hypothetical protein